MAEPEDSRTQTTISRATPEPEEQVVRLVRRRNAEASEPEFHETFQGSKPGARFVRRMRSRDQKLRRVGANLFEAMPAVLRPQSPFGRFAIGLRHALLGRTLASSELGEQRLGKLKALAVFSSDALSSSAYATEEILLVLIAAGTGALTHSIYIAVAIAVLAFIVVLSYQQTIRAYPNGGGAYIVATENLSPIAGLTAGSALLVDYIMTVAVSTAAGVAAVTSALPSLHGERVPLALVFVGLITLGNLRGIRESGTIFAIPTYFFILTFGGMVAYGILRVFVAGADLHAVEQPGAIEAGTSGLGLFLLLRAFSSGSAALTGIEAVANGVPSFKAPEAKNAANTQMWMASILVAFFVGTTILAHQIDVIPSESKTVVAQIAEVVFGHGVLFYVLQVSTALILVLAANTAFAGLPTLASVMARDRVMPSQFAFRGDRLAFSNGILVLGGASSVVLMAFAADTHKIIPLYAFGVFTAFTLSQVGMIVHWRRNRETGWRRALAINAVGAVATGVVAIIVGATKFSHGAWLSIALMGLIIAVLWFIRAHYADAARQLKSGLESPPGISSFFAAASTARAETVLVPVEGINRAVLRTIAYARTISLNATAVHVAADAERAKALRERWDAEVPDVSLVILDSPYDSLVEPICAYIDALDRKKPNQVVTVVFPEFQTSRRWQRLLHNKLAPTLKKALLGRPHTVLVDVPFHFH